jgi:hypothetical protein
MQTLIPDVTNVFSSASAALDHATILVEDLIATGRPATERQLAILRRDLPYSVHPVPGSPATGILVNRYYKPLGCPDRHKFARYEEFVRHHLQCGQDQIECLAVGPGHHHLYEEEAEAPWNGCARAKAFRERLLSLKLALVKV